MKKFSMGKITINSDAFSHGQIKSKLWLLNAFQKLFSSDAVPKKQFILHWYGSWVGVGPFLLLTQYDDYINEINLYDIEASDLDSSLKILNFWFCEGLSIKTHTSDVNTIHLDPSKPNQIVINTSCEHIIENQWIENIPKATRIILQSTDMPHIEHVNSPKNLEDFIQKYEKQIEIHSHDALNFNYPNMNFSRYMLSGIKK